MIKGCFPYNQPSFEPDYRTVEEMLRRKLRDSDAVIHIVGFRFGAEPKHRPASAPPRSYTQMEFCIAREMEIPVFVFLSSDASVRDPAKSDETPQDADAESLQLAHRIAVQSTNYLSVSITQKCAEQFQSERVIFHVLNKVFEVGTTTAFLTHA